MRKHVAILVLAICAAACKQRAPASFVKAAGQDKAANILAIEAYYSKFTNLNQLSQEIIPKGGDVGLLYNAMREWEDNVNSWDIESNSQQALESDSEFEERLNASPSRSNISSRELETLAIIDRASQGADALNTMLKMHGALNQHRFLLQMQLPAPTPPEEKTQKSHTQYIEAQYRFSRLVGPSSPSSMTLSRIDACLGGLQHGDRSRCSANPQEGQP